MIQAPVPGIRVTSCTICQRLTILRNEYGPRGISSQRAVVLSRAPDDRRRYMVASFPRPGSPFALPWRNRSPPKWRHRTAGLRILSSDATILPDFTPIRNFQPPRRQPPLPALPRAGGEGTGGGDWQLGTPECPFASLPNCLIAQLPRGNLGVMAVFFGSGFTPSDLPAIVTASLGCCADS
jgi:hypothetical protein